MDSPDLDNQTEFEVHPQMVLHKSGERLLVVVKATFVIDPAQAELPLASEELARPVRLGDVMWGEPEIESIKYPSDLFCSKPGTDVVFVGTAFAPKATPVSEFDAYLRVGPVAKALRIFGLRVWDVRGGGLSGARPIASLDVRYDFAWGGRDISDAKRPLEEARNPVGRGIAANLDLLTHTLAPQIEDPDNLIRSVSTKPPPAGLGALGRSFSQRRQFVGTYDESWKNFRAPLPPTDEDDRFNHVASVGLTAEPPLSGGEECALLNLSEQSPLQFRLPRVALQVGFFVKNREPALLRPHLDTVLIDTWGAGPESPPVLEMTWRASVPAPRRMKDARITIVELEHL